MGPAGLKHAVLGLPQPMRDVFLLHRMKSLSYSEIAEFMGIASDEVQALLVEALVRLVQNTFAADRRASS